MKKKKKEEKINREKIIDFGTKMNAEGREYFFLGYSTPDSYEWLPEDFKKSWQALIDANCKLDNELTKLLEEYDIDEADIEY